MIQVILRVVAGPETGRAFVFPESDRFLIGRAENAHFRFVEADPYISRNHCLLEICPPNVYLRDLQSRNGTFVDGSPVSEAQLRDGSRVGLGATIMQVQLREVGVEEGRREPPTVRLTGIHAPPEASHSEGDSRGACVKCRRACPKTPGLTPEWERCLYLCDDCAAEIPHDIQPERVGAYRLLSELGRGAMGVVFKARHQGSGRLVAAKRLLPSTITDRRANELFQREIAVLKMLSHPNIVQLLDQTNDGQDIYFISEYLEGGDLNRIVADGCGPLGIAEACRYIFQILSGLELAHRMGYVHRDVKPANMLLDRLEAKSRVAKLSDFGLAKSFTEAGASFMTRRGEAAGTLLYMAPEQIFNYRYVKPPADLYSTGVSLYFLLTGGLPFSAISARDDAAGGPRHKPKDELRVVLEDEPIPVRDQRTDIPAEIARVVDWSIRKRETERYQSATEMKSALEKACVSQGLALSAPFSGKAGK
jgi:serine/threonine-protein kinase